MVNFDSVKYIAKVKAGLIAKGLDEFSAEHVARRANANRITRWSPYLTICRKAVTSVASDRRLDPITFGLLTAFCYRYTKVLLSGYGDEALDDLVDNWARRTKLVPADALEDIAKLVESYVKPGAGAGAGAGTR